MLRISEVELLDDATTLRMEGEMIGAGVEEVRQLIAQSLAAGQRLTLDLAELRFVDRDGVALFRELAGHQVQFINCSPFLNEQLKDAINPIGEKR